MPRPNIEEEIKRFKERLEHGYFKVDRLGCSEENYSERKLARDTEALQKQDSGIAEIWKEFIDHI